MACCCSARGKRISSIEQTLQPALILDLCCVGRRGRCRKVDPSERLLLLPCRGPRSGGAGLFRRGQTLCRASRRGEQAGGKNSRRRWWHDAPSRSDGCAAKRHGEVDSFTHPAQSRFGPSKAVQLSRSKTARRRPWISRCTSKAKLPRSPKKSSMAISSTILTAIAVMAQMRPAANWRPICGAR